MLKASKSRQSVDGQAIVEYLIMITLALALVTSFNSSIRKSLAGLWTFYTQSVSAACPTGCPAETRYRLR